MSKKLKLTFYGGVGTVTGSNFMLENENIKILVDAGMENSKAVKENDSYFAYDPTSVDVLVVTNPNMGNIGMTPLLVKAGFKGNIYSTLETKSLSKMLFLDAISSDNIGDDKSVLFNKEDVDNVMSLWGTLPYYQKRDIGKGFEMELKNSGHSLGSSLVAFSYNKKKIIFTGFLGNSPHPLLKDLDIVKDADYLVIESVYGDKIHESREDRTEMFEDVIEATVNRGGALVIPTFSLERTQDILFEIHKLIDGGKIPSVPVFIDSPFSETIVDLYEKGYENFNEEAKKMMAERGGIFNFPQVKFVNTDKESEEMRNLPNPKIIIGGVGISGKKRICDHERNCISDPNSTILFVEYQPVGSLGRQLQEGVDVIEINGEKVSVMAQIDTINGYSSHGDFNTLFDFVSGTRNTVEKVFVVMGEPKSSIFLVQKLKDYLGVDAVYPKKGESYELDVE